MKYTIGLSGVALQPNNHDETNLRTAWHRNETKSADSFSTFFEMQRQRTI